MKFTTAALMLSVGFTIAAPSNTAKGASVAASAHGLDIDVPSTAEKRVSPRFTCGQYKFDDGTVQEFYSQVWAGLPADQMICRLFKYEFRGKKGQEGKMVAAKVDKGCTCFFYEVACDPGQGRAEIWDGWMGWQNYAATDKSFKGWYCFEQS